jgi:hypothetical protein
MSANDDARRDAEERAFAERIADEFAPPAMSEARAAAFDARLHERLEAPSRRGRAWLPALVTLAAVCAIWLGTGLWSASDPPRSASARAGAWETELLLGSDLVADPDAADAYLPDDYSAIAVVFLDG